MSELRVLYLGLQPYVDVWRAMQSVNRQQLECDQLWLVEHFPVYTIGSKGGKEHILTNNNIPVIETDRGGSVTYHGPGQLVIYPMINVRQYAFSLKELIDRLELVLLSWISLYINGLYLIYNQRGIYIDQHKIASMGLRIANGKTYHGMSVNINMDLSDFDNINPCGYHGLKMTQWSKYADFPRDWYCTLEDVFKHNLGYRIISRENRDARTSGKITWPRQVIQDSYTSSGTA